MASASGKGTAKSRTGTSRSSSKGTRKTASGTRNGRSAGPVRKSVDVAVKNEVALIVIFAAAIFIFLCVTGVIKGTASTGIRNVMFGLFGLLAYLVPVIIFVGFAFGISNKGNTVAVIKLVSSAVLVILAGVLAFMFMKQEKLLTGASLVRELYQTSMEHHAGGGVIFGSIAHALYSMIGFGGTLFLVTVLGIISVVFITEKSFLTGVKKGGSYLIESAREDAVRMREYRESLRDEYEEGYDEEQDCDDQQDFQAYGREQRPRRRKRRDERVEGTERKVKRMDKKARGVVSSAEVFLKQDRSKDDAVRQDIHEITLLDDNEAMNGNAVCEEISLKPYNAVQHGVHMEDMGTSPDAFFPGTDESDAAAPDTMEAELLSPEIFGPELNFDEDALDSMPEPVTEGSAPAFEEEAAADSPKAEQTEPEQLAAVDELPREYIFPPLSLLKKGKGKKGDSSSKLRETALKLQQTLQNFGVRVTITDISQGPSVTRYEMQPEQGVKVSKIVGLADDIKLNLAATDIRIEAPIPGKAAVGIEVPNKENSAVALRDLLESSEFQKFPSSLAFAVGKDIGGKVVVTDIAKMPHVLIAGATGSGKSVCINTIIMSILYKANPSDVKLIMIDPKVVELSVYNGIPHLMVPVVTDPKKASAALNWGVTEMDDRYKKFADLNVRDLKGYNKAAEMGKLSPDGEPLQKLPQIVIIVDELADLMMVASGEVEESICRLAQLARACGIHLVIATQRPSVDVITGLIKANMPSRIAFSVSSGTDSRTILDMVGAEKLLGKGDMLFYPQGYTKPARVQGAFVSDSEVTDVVDFLKNQMIGNTYVNEIEDKIKSMQSAPGSGGTGGNDVDVYFADAGKFVIEKDKASIGMLQRMFKIGFNRAARIVDQLEEAGVVAAEEGTKPRRILMSMEQFQNYLEENA